MRYCDIWKEQCEAARQIEAEFGTQKALSYLIGEKFLSNQALFERNTTHRLRKKNQNPRGIVIT
jgi:hypothetical protein